LQEGLAPPVVGRSVRVEHSTETVLDAQHVVVDGVELGGVEFPVRRGVDQKAGVVKAREVKRSRRLLEIAEVERERHEEARRVGCRLDAVVEVGHLVVVGRNLHRVAEVSSVDLEGEGEGRGGTVGGVSGLGGNVGDGVVVAELLRLLARSSVLLNLLYEHVNWVGGEPPTLGVIEVDEVRPALDDLARGIGRRPVDANLNVVILESHEGKCLSPVVTEEKVEGVVRLRGGRLFSLVGGGSLDLGPDGVRVDRVLVINALTADVKLDVVNVLRHVDFVCGTVLRGQVGVRKHVTLALKTDGRHAVGRWVSLDYLAMANLRKVGVALVIRTEKGNLRITHDVDILGSCGN
tara:strand:- start:4470 stop:5516 length:1047 start_codon:yes stop_codon:yes gene_type:complete